jgi:hypothetical protein
VDRVAAGVAWGRSDGSRADGSRFRATTPASGWVSRASPLRSSQEHWSWLSVSSIWWMLKGSGISRKFMSAGPPHRQAPVLGLRHSIPQSRGLRTTLTPKLTGAEIGNALCLGPAFDSAWPPHLGRAVKAPMNSESIRRPGLGHRHQPPVEVRNPCAGTQDHTARLSFNKEA